MSEHMHLPFYSQELARTEISDSTKYGQCVFSLLGDGKILQEVNNGNLTVAMIRPNVGPDANLLGLPDAECADKIEEMIEGLGLAAKFSVKFTEDVVDEFYNGDPQAVMEKAAPLDGDKFDSRWPEFKEFMASGTTTILLLHSQNGDAVDRWRDHLGHWNIDRFRDPTTIRGALGVNLYNNLVHGSDSTTSVLRELSLLRHLIKGKK